MYHMIFGNIFGNNVMKKILFLVAFLVIFTVVSLGNLQAMVQRVAEVTTVDGVTTTNMVAYTAPQSSRVVIQPETFVETAVAALQYPPMLALVLVSIAVAVYALMVLPRRINRWWNSWLRNLRRHHERPHQHKFA